MCARTSSDSARLGLIFWPVMMFAACGFEHSIANMFTFALALLSGAADVSLGGVLANLAWVTLGNAIGGMLMVGAGYWAQSQAALASCATAKAAPAPLRER
jgi:nitrite transporter NirC